MLEAHNKMLKRETLCRTCKGTGKVTVKDRGLYVRQTCPTCKGLGKQGIITK